MKRVVKIFNKHLNDDDGLLKSGGIFLAGAVTVALFNYLYHLAMGRMLGPNEYGILGSLFAIIYLVCFSTETFNKVISKYTAEFHGKQQSSHLKRLIKRAIVKSSLFGAVGLIAYLAASPWIAEFMGIENIASVRIVGVIAYLLVISSILAGGLNGLQKFFVQNLSSVCFVVFKFLLAVALVYLGFGVNGALIAILAGVIAGIIICMPSITKILGHPKCEKFDSRKVYIYMTYVFIGSLFPILLITFDQILVKHFFSSQDAGYYAAAGMIAKIIWFGSGFFAGAFFPKIAAMAATGKDTSKILVKCLSYTSILAVLGISVYFIMPDFIVRVLYGTSYSAISPVIGIFGVGMGLFSLIQILVVYNLAVERYSFAWIAAAAFAMEISGIFIFHSSILQVIKIVFAANLFLFFSLLIYTRKQLGVNCV